MDIPPEQGRSSRWTSRQLALVGGTAGAVLILVVVVVVGFIAANSGSGGGDGDADVATIQLRPPTDVALRVVADSCDDESCQVETTFTDRSEGESRTVARFEFDDPNVPLIRGAESGVVDGIGDSASITKSVPVDQPFCVSLSAAGFEERSEPSEEVCKVVTLGGRMAETDGLVGAEDLAINDCVDALPGEDLTEAVTLVVKVECEGAAASVVAVQESLDPAFDATICSNVVPSGLTGAALPTRSGVSPRQVACLLNQ